MQGVSGTQGGGGNDRVSRNTLHYKKWTGKEGARFLFAQVGFQILKVDRCKEIYLL